MPLIKIKDSNLAGLSNIRFDVYDVSSDVLIASVLASEIASGEFQVDSAVFVAEYYSVKVYVDNVLHGTFLWDVNAPNPEVEVSYKGVWDASTNTPSLNDSYAGKAGDFYFVSVSGTTVLGGVNNWSRGDRLIWSGEVWHKVARNVPTFATSRQTVLNTETAIFADGEAAARDPGGRPGWCYKNTAGNKINWYLWAGVSHQDYLLNQLDGIYFVVDIKAQGSMPYWTVYTKPEGDGNDASWYRSRINYVDEAASAALPAGRYLFHTSGLDVTGIEPTLTRLPLPIGLNTVGPQGGTEALWLMALSTSSGYPAGTNEFIIERVGVSINDITHELELAAVDTSPAYTDYYKGSYVNANDYPESGAQGQWIINSTDDTTLVWDTEGGDWVATGAGAEAPTAISNDYPFQYVYSSLDGSGYGYEAAYPDGQWSNTPDGKIQADGGGSNILARHVKFATLKNPGDEVTIQCSDNLNAYNRYCVIGLTPGTDASALSWKVAGQPSSGVSWMLSNSADYSLVELYTAYIEPYWGGTSYGYNLQSRSNSSNLGGMSGNQGEKPVTFRVGTDYRIEIYIEGHFHVKTNSVPTSGVDLYIATYPGTGRIWDQPTGSGANIVGGTAPNATGARYYMSTVSTPGTGTELASGNGYFLYSDTAPGDASDIELDDAEAQAARWCRVFIDYTGDSVDERYYKTLPVVQMDQIALDHVKAKAQGYFHSLDLTPAEIAAKMTEYKDALEAATAGAVEICLQTVQGMIAADPGASDIDLKNHMVEDLQLQLQKFPR